MVKNIQSKNSYLKKDDSFSSYKKMIETTNGLSLSQVCSITNLEPYTIQNWVKRGYIPHPINKKYYTKHLARILTINALKECMFIDDINSLMVYINGDVDDEADDIISEEDLYQLFSNLVYNLKDYNKIEELVKNSIKNNKLRKCMTIMLYAYVSGIMSKQANKHLQALKKEV